MKKCPLIKKIYVLILAITALIQSGLGQPLLVDNFSYTSASLLTSNGWTRNTDSGTNTIPVNSSGLTFTGYPGSGTGLSAIMNKNGEEVYRLFTGQSTAGTAVYVSFMCQVNAAATGYFIHLGENPFDSGIQRGKLFITAAGTGLFNFGVSKNSTTGTYTGSSYTIGTTYTVVLKYNIVSGLTNDEVSMFIFSGSIPSTEPSATLTATDNSATDINPGSIALRQFSSSHDIIVDGIRVTNNWSDIVTTDATAPVATFVPASAATTVKRNIAPTITFNEPVMTTAGAAITSSNIASLITFKSGTTDVPFYASIDNTKQVITITPTSSLSYSTTYTLTVAVEDGSANETSGLSSSFTTLSATDPDLSVLTPVNDLYYATETLPITWNTTSVANVKIEISTSDDDGNYTWSNIIASTPSDGSYSYTIPSDYYYGYYYKVLITDVTNASVYSESDNFTVVASASNISDFKTKYTAGTFDISDVVKLKSEAIITFMYKPSTVNNIYVQESGAGILVYDNSGKITTSYNQYDGITGITGFVGSLLGTLIIIPISDPGAATSTSNSVTPVSLTAAQLSSGYETYESMLINLSDVTFTAGNGTATFASSTDYTITDAGGSSKCRTSFTNADYIGSTIPSGITDITGLCIDYNGSRGISPRNSADFSFATTGIEAFNSDELTVYPVPATTDLFVKNASGVSTVEVLDITGTVLMSYDKTGETEFSIPVGDLKKGVYIIRMGTAGSTIIKKFVK